MEILKKDIKGAFVQIANIFEVGIECVKGDINEKCNTLANTVIKLYGKIAILEKTITSINKSKNQSDRKPGNQHLENLQRQNNHQILENVSLE